MEKILFSLIVPVYNVAPYIQRCLQSISDQTYQNIEVLIIDDGSTDGGDTLCKNYTQRDNRFIYYKKTNGGLSSARNYGLKKASGDYILFIDSDDYIDKNTCEILKSYITQGDYDVISYNNIDVYSTQKKIHTFNKSIQIESSDFALKKLLLGKMQCSVCCVAIKRALAQNVSFIEGRINEDLPYMYEILKKTTLVLFLPNAFYYYVHREGSISTSPNIKKRYDVYLNTAEILKDVSEKKPHLLQEAKYQFYQYGIIERLYDYIKIGDTNDTEYKIIHKEFSNNLIEIIKSKHILLKTKIRVMALFISPHCFKIMESLKSLIK